MDQRSRTELVVTLFWLGLGFFSIQNISTPYHFWSEYFVWIVTPALAYWTYRFIRAGRPSKVNQPE